MFKDYDTTLPAFALFGGEREGGALLDSALALPRQTFGGRPLYRTIYEKAGVLLRSLIKNHPLVDGNKRLAMATTALFLFMNGYLLLPPSREMVRFALKVAASEPDMDWQEVAGWIRQHTVRLTPNRAELMKAVRAQSRDPDETVELLKRHWSEIAQFVEG